VGIICKDTGVEHAEYDFDGEGRSTTGCSCKTAPLDDIDSTPVYEGPSGEESYEHPEGSDE
jgi:hypothetical protein